MILRVILLTLLISTCTLSTLNVMAAPKATTISAQQAAKIVQNRFGGKILKVQKVNDFYKVKIVKANGQVTSKTVNAKTGRLIGN